MPVDIKQTHTCLLFLSNDWYNYSRKSALFDHVGVIFGRLCITFHDDAGALFGHMSAL